MDDKLAKLTQAVADKKASDRAAFGRMIADVGKCTTVAQIKAEMIKLLTYLSR